MDRPRFGPAILLVIVTILVGVCAVAASAGEISKKPAVVVCLRRVAQHPRNCSMPLGFPGKQGVNIRFFNFQALHWHDWGSSRATATGVTIDPRTHARARVALAITGLETCEHRDFYSKMLVKRPRRLNPRHLTAGLPIPTCPPHHLH